MGSDGRHCDIVVVSELPHLSIIMIVIGIANWNNRRIIRRRQTIHRRCVDEYCGNFGEVKEAKFVRRVQEVRSHQIDRASTMIRTSCD